MDTRTLPATFAELLQRYRRAAGMTQEELAERAHLSVRGISNLERGVRRLPQRGTVTLLIGALGLAEAERGAFEAAARGLDDPSPATPVRPTLTIPTNLPLALTSFVGRERAIATARPTGFGRQLVHLWTRWGAQLKIAWWPPCGPAGRLPAPWRTCSTPRHASSSPVLLDRLPGSVPGDRPTSMDSSGMVPEESTRSTEGGLEV
jgi:transcriptional regulator with XRE-family HTH domain